LLSEAAFEFETVTPYCHRYLRAEAGRMARVITGGGCGWRGGDFIAVGLARSQHPARLDA